MKFLVTIGKVVPIGKRPLSPEFLRAYLYRAARAYSAEEPCVEILTENENMRVRGRLVSVKIDLPEEMEGADVAQEIAEAIYVHSWGKDNDLRFNLRSVSFDGETYHQDDE